MAISNSLLKEFAEITNDSVEETPNNELRATVKSTGDGVVYVQIDGNAESDGLTPATTTTNLAVGDRVYVTIQNHSAIITGNITDPSVTNTDLTEAVDGVSAKFEVLEDKITSEVKKLDESMSTKITQTEESIEAVSKKVNNNTTSISTLTQTANSLSSEISTKVGDDEIISKINQSAESISISADKINLDGLTTFTTEPIGPYKSSLTVYGASIEFSSGGKIYSTSGGLINVEIPSRGLTFEGSKVYTTYLQAKKIDGCKFTVMPKISLDDTTYMEDTGYDLIRNDTPTSSMSGWNMEPYNITAPSYYAVANMINNIKNLIPDTSSFVTSSTLSNYVTSSQLTNKVADIQKWVNSNYQKKSSSDIRLKKNVYVFDDATDFYMDLSPVHFNYCDDVDDLDSRNHYGFVAQDVLSIQKYHNISDFGFVEKVSVPLEGGYDKYIPDNEMYVVHYDELHALHVQMIQKQQKMIETLTARVEALEAKLNEKE